MRDEKELRFQDIVMQKHYEQLVKDGYHWKIAEKKTITRFNEYDSEE